MTWASGSSGPTFARGSIHLVNGPGTTELIRSLLDSRPCGLMTDIDGTVSRIAAHPDEATVDPAAKRALDALSQHLDLVAAISGRGAEDARSIVGLDSLIYSGNHGMEIWREGKLEPSDVAAQYVPRIREILTDLEKSIDLSGVYLENKQLTASIHYRKTDDPDQARLILMTRVEPLAFELGLRITHGRMVIEIRPPIELNKGTSVIDLIQRFSLAGAVYIGDDVTDVDAFRALRERRQTAGS
jgi:trehalose 6-phosphate phosphatase